MHIRYWNYIYINFSRISKTSYRSVNICLASINISRTAGVKQYVLRTFQSEGWRKYWITSVFIFILGSLRSATRPAQRCGLNFSSRMRSKRFDYCNKYLTIFQITLQTATFGWSDAMFAVILTKNLSNTSWVALSFHVDWKMY
jgi:hypothetical protein